MFLLVSFLAGQRSPGDFMVFHLLSLVFGFWGLGIAKGTIQKALGIALCGVLGAGAVVVFFLMGAGK